MLRKIKIKCVLLSVCTDRSTYTAANTSSIGFTQITVFGSGLRNLPNFQSERHGAQERRQVVFLITAYSCVASNGKVIFNCELGLMRTEMILDSFESLTQHSPGDTAHNYECPQLYDRDSNP
jgi:hypothetical protein